jgi:hypothetical protein
MILMIDRLLFQRTYKLLVYFKLTHPHGLINFPKHSCHVKSIKSDPGINPTQNLDYESSGFDSNGFIFLLALDRLIHRSTNKEI